MQLRRIGLSRRGVTLLEVMIYTAVWTALAVATMRVIGDGRTLRSNARDRGAMVLIAQNELERARTLPSDKLTTGSTERTSADWPSGVKARVELSPRADGAWLVDVVVTRESVEGKPSVRLATVRPGVKP
jgi:hypothetical protein